MGLKPMAQKKASSASAHIKTAAASGEVPLAKRLDLLRRLSEAPGVSGDETAVRDIVLEQIRDSVEEARTDALGNVLVRCRVRDKPSLRVMVAAHMDEVGLMIVRATNEGLLKFETVGGVDTRTLLAIPVRVGKNQIRGVIGAKPAHLTDRDEEARPVKKESMAIDIGAKEKAAAQEQAKPGDRAVFATAFQSSRGVLRGKALDNRLGVAALVELALNPPPGIELVLAFTVQEEIGLRGAKTAAHALDPKIAIVLDATPAMDMPMWDGSENTTYNSKLGGGPAIYLADRGTLYDRKLIDMLIDSAQTNAIPCQFRQPGGGGTDAGVIHLAREGIPCAAISVPARSLHTPCSTARLEDWLAYLALIRAVLVRLGKTK
jgi:tetrahedral aminopeptidase